MTQYQMELVIRSALFLLGFSISQLIGEFNNLRRIRKAVERFAEDFSREVKER